MKTVHETFFSYMVNGKPVYLKPRNVEARKQKDYSHLPLCDRPMAMPYLTSYRIMGRFGWIMIGASNIEEAMKEGGRSTPNPDRSALQVWDGGLEKYVPC